MSAKKRFNLGFQVFLKTIAIPFCVVLQKRNFVLSIHFPLNTKTKKLLTNNILYVVTISWTKKYTQRFLIFIAFSLI